MDPGARPRVGPPPRLTTPESRLGFGAWAVGGEGWGPADDERSCTAAVERALERGVTFFDTAPSYGGGASEALLGRILGRAGDRVAIATKVGPHDDARRSLEASLRRLHRDHVDLVQLHEAGDRWEWQLERLYRLEEEGKALAVGLCNATRAQIARGLDLAPLATFQGPYNIIDRDVEQRELPLCRERDLAFLAYRPLASGLLTGKYPTPPAFPASDHRARLYWFKGPEFVRRRRVVDRLQAMATARGTSPAVLALAWLLARPGVTVVLAGARNARQVDENLAAVVHPLGGDDMAAIDALVTQVFALPRADEHLRALAIGWGARERFIVERLDGTISAEVIAAEWTDRGDPPMVAAQVKVFVDQLVARGLVARAAATGEGP